MEYTHAVIYLCFIHSHTDTLCPIHNCPELSSLSVSHTRSICPSLSASHSLSSETHTCIQYHSVTGGCGDLDDNDGIYLKGIYNRQQDHKVKQGSVISDCTFSHGADDAIDINGAMVMIKRTLIDGWKHEGVAASGTPLAVVIIKVPYTVLLILIYQ